MRGGFHLPPGGSQGQNPAAGAAVYYSLKEKPKDEVTLEFLDNSGKLIRKFSSKPPAKKTVAEGDEEEEGPPHDADRVPTEAGLNRFVWNLRYPDATTFPGLIMWAGSVRGPGDRAGQLQGAADGERQIGNRKVSK